MTSEVVEVTVREGQSWNALAYLRKADGTQALQVDLQTITLFVYDNSNALISQESYPVSDDTVVFDTPQTDGHWTVDDVGYTFRGRVRSELLSKGSGRYRGELIGVLWNDTGTADPDIIPVIYEITVKPLLSG